MPYWAKGTDAERQRLTEAFERMSVATYADRFDGFSGESFQTIGQKPDAFRLRRRMRVAFAIETDHDEALGETADHGGPDQATGAGYDDDVTAALDRLSSIRKNSPEVVEYLYDTLRRP